MTGETNLRILDASHSGITDDDIKNLNKFKLHADGNKKITNVNHMSNLRVLVATYTCGMFFIFKMFLRNIFEDGKMILVLRT